MRGLKIILSTALLFFTFGGQSQSRISGLSLLVDTQSLLYEINIKAQLIPLATSIQTAKPLLMEPGQISYMPHELNKIKNSGIPLNEGHFNSLHDSLALQANAMYGKWQVQQPQYYSYVQLGGFRFHRITERQLLSSVPDGFGVRFSF